MIIKRVICLTIGATLVSNALAQSSGFGPLKELSGSTSSARSVYATDLDGDGDADVLSASYMDDKIAWYENLGGGSIGRQQIISTTANGPVHIHAADLDGDGDTDVLSASRLDSKIAWYENLGGGLFGAEQVITTTASIPYCVYAADLNGDGLTDVLSGSNGSMEWYLNLGGGAFGLPNTFTSTPLYPNTIYADDIDGDGDLDVLCGGGIGTDTALAWFENIGSGVFTYGERIATTTESAFIWRVHAEDLDNDGDLDVLSATVSDGKIAWYENLGGGMFGPQQVIMTLTEAYDVYAKDLDGDGDADVLSASGMGGSGKVAWYENIGGGVFGPIQVLSTLEITGYCVFAEDLDGDGDVDVLSGGAEPNYIGFSNEHVIWHENLGGGAFGTRQDISASADGAESVFAVDMDGDSDYDVLSASFIDDKIAWYENLGGGIFAVQRVISHLADGPYSVYAEDLDGDGDPDVLSASLVDDKIAWYENIGSGMFGPQQVISTAAEWAQSVYAVDLDGDGDADVLSASYGDDKIAWYENLGGGNFSGQNVITTIADGAFKVMAQDLDSDGDADVLSISKLDSKAAWYENLGGGLFGPQQVIATFDINGVTSMHPEDLDGDGDFDMLYTTYANGFIIWCENLGLGAFGPKLVIDSMENGGAQVHAEDLDGDGDPDILSAGNSLDYYAGYNISWHENLGGGAFSPGQLITNIPEVVTSMWTEDLDGDGDADVLSASRWDDRVAWYENLMGVPAACIDAPSNPSAVGIAADRALLSWSSVDSPAIFLLQGRPVGGGGGTHGYTDDTSVLAMSLIPSTSYMWRVRTKCPGGVKSPWSMIDTFTTTMLRIESTHSSALQSIEVYPNPASSVLHIAHQDLDISIGIELMDATGQTIVKQHILGASVLDVSDLAPGHYFISLTSSKGHELRKVIIE